MHSINSIAAWTFGEVDELWMLFLGFMSPPCQWNFLLDINDTSYVLTYAYVVSSQYSFDRCINETFTRMVTKVVWSLGGQNDHRKYNRGFFFFFFNKYENMVELSTAGMLKVLILTRILCLSALELLSVIASTAKFPCFIYVF